MTSLCACEFRRSDARGHEGVNGVRRCRRGSKPLPHSWHLSDLSPPDPEAPAMTRQTVPSRRADPWARGLPPTSYVCAPAQCNLFTLGRRWHSGEGFVARRALPIYLRIIRRWRRASGALLQMGGRLPGDVPDTRRHPRHCLRCAGGPRPPGHSVLHAAALSCTRGRLGLFPRVWPLRQGSRVSGTFRPGAPCRRLISVGSRARGLASQRRLW